MTRDALSEPTATTSEEFQTVLTTVVERAIDAGIDVRGAWEFQTRGSAHEWEVEIMELARELDDEDEW